MFESDGWVKLPAFFDKATVNTLEDAILDIYHTQARKIKDYQNLPRDMRAILTAMEANDKDILYECLKMIPQSLAVRSVYGAEFAQKLADYCGADPKTTLIEGPSLFANNPETSRVSYKLHTEALFYSKRRKFCNVWTPLYGPRTKENGAMIVLPGSHLDHWDMSKATEYTGFDIKSKGKEKWGWQIEIPPKQVEKYKVEYTEATPGDIVVFHRNLVHGTGINITDQIAFALVCRVWDYSTDYSFSANMNTMAYKNGDVGRPDLVC